MFDPEILNISQIYIYCTYMHTYIGSIHQDQYRSDNVFSSYQCYNYKKYIKKFLYFLYYIYIMFILYFKYVFKCEGKRQRHSIWSESSSPSGHSVKLLSNGSMLPRWTKADFMSSAARQNKHALPRAPLKQSHWFRQEGFYELRCGCDSALFPAEAEKKKTFLLIYNLSCIHNGWVLKHCPRTF